MLFMWVTANAQCPGTGQRFAANTYGTMYYFGNYMASAMGPGPLNSFILNGTNMVACTTAKFGPNPPDTCVAATSVDLDNDGVFGSAIGPLFLNFSQNVTQNGCSFTCPGGSCRVRGGDGLPVELILFEVDVTPE